MACWGTVVVRWAQEEESKRFPGSNLNTVHTIEQFCNSLNHPKKIHNCFALELTGSKILIGGNGQDLGRLRIKKRETKQQNEKRERKSVA